MVSPLILGYLIAMQMWELKARDPACKRGSDSWACLRSPNGFWAGPEDVAIFTGQFLEHSCARNPGSRHLQLGAWLLPFSQGSPE